jgi:hypothetical protein
VAEWEFNPVRPPCDVCSLQWKEHDIPTHEVREKLENTCWNCEKPELLPENLEAWEFYGLVGDQVISSGFGIIGLNKLAVINILKLYSIDSRDELSELLEKIIIIHNVAMKHVPKPKIKHGRSSPTVRGSRRRYSRP